MRYGVNLTGIHLEHALTNAAGTCKLLNGPEGVKTLARSCVSAITVGSITCKERTGNPGETYWGGPNYSLNSRGLPNPGKEYYIKQLPKMVRVAKDASKPLFVSVAGSTPTEYAELTELAFKAGADLVELNLSCPNLGSNSPIICYDPGLTGKILRQIRKNSGQKAKIAVKIAPFPDSFALKRIVKVIAKSEVVKAVTACNTLPNVLDYDPSGKPRIGPNEGLGGFGGSGFKPIVLGQVKQLSKMLPDQIRIIGVGGIQSGQDIVDYLQTGASIVQVATAFFNTVGINVFDRLLSEFVDAATKVNLYGR